MKKVRNCMILLASIMLLGMIFFLDTKTKNMISNYSVFGEYIKYENTVMGIVVLDDFSFLEKKKKLELSECPQICFENTSLPYDFLENIVYLPQNHEVEEWEGTLSCVGEVVLCTREDSYWQEKQEAIKQSYEFPLWIVTKEGYCELRLIASGIPMINISTQRCEEAEEIPYELDPDKKFYGSETKYYGEMRLFNPGIGVNGYEIIECKVEYHEKGDSSKEYPKKAYSLKLLNTKEEKLDMPLLGMRSDNSWKLNALMNDPSRVREKATAQLWEQIDLANETVNEAGPRMEYVELVLDGEYLGLYCLVEPIDEKKLELDENDVLYKIIGWCAPSNDEIQLSIRNGWKISLPIRVRYPKIIRDYEAAWYPISDYLNIFYRDYWQYGGGIEKIDLGNACDIVIFLMACSVSDNNFKNLYLAADVSYEGDYIIRHIPWDLDASFGLVYDEEVEGGIRFEKDETIRYWDAPISTMLYYEIEGVYECLMERWSNYRETMLHTDNIILMLEQNREYLIDTGGYIREQKRWNNYEVSSDIDEIVDYQVRRMIWLDGYFESLK